MAYEEKYDSLLSWADLIVLISNCALEIMNFPTFGFGGGLRDAWEPDLSTYWGSEFWNSKPFKESKTGEFHNGYPLKW